MRSAPNRAAGSGRGSVGAGRAYRLVVGAVRQLGTCMSGIGSGSQAACSPTSTTAGREWSS
jgi:hypothetical protein